MDWVQNFKELAVGASALSAAAVAWRGLSTWKAQLQGEHHHKVAREALVAIFEYRNFVLNSRERYMEVMESTAKNELAHALSGETYAKRIFKEFPKDYKTLAEKNAELEQVALEVELLWDKHTAEQIQLIIAMGRDMADSLMLVEAFVDGDVISGYNPKEIVKSLGGLPHKTQERLLSYSINRVKTEKHDDSFPATLSAICGDLKVKLGSHLVPHQGGWRSWFDGKRKK